MHVYMNLLLQTTLSIVMYCLSGGSNILAGIGGIVSMMFNYTLKLVGDMLKAYKQK